MGLLDKAKDFGIRAALNRLLAGVGEIRELRVDREARRMICELVLEGEASPIAISLDGWELGDGAHANQVRILGLHSNRPWLDEIARRALVERWVDVPAQHMGKLRAALG